MWIEKIKLLGFGGISQELVEFGANEINLIVEPNEYGKSTLAECIWATLFDFPEHGTNRHIAEKESLKPWNEDAPFQAVIDLVHHERAIQITRDFAAKTVQVIDRSTNEDITDEYRGANGEDHVGVIVTGMSRDLFRNTCLLGQRHLDKNHLANSTDISQVVQGMADTSSPASSSSDATEALNQALLNYTYSNRRASIDVAIKDLEQAKNDLEQKVKAMDDDRENVSEWMAELSALDEGGPGAPTEPVELDASLTSEYDSLRLDLKDVDKTLESVKQKYEQKVLLETRVKEMDMTTPVQNSIVVTLQDYWTRRQSRISDAEGMGEQIQPQQEEYERLEQEINDRYKNMEHFTLDEANAISALAVNMYKIQQELENMQKNVQEQTGKHLLKLMQTSKQHNVALDVLKDLTRAEIEEAKNYSSLLVMFHEQLQEEQKKIQETKFSIDDIEERRKAKRNSNLGISIGSFFFALLLGGFLAFTTDLQIPELVKILCAGIMIISLVIALTVFGMVINFTYYLRDDADSAKEEENKHRKALAAAKTKISNLEAKLTAMAIKTGASNKDDLLRYIEDASDHEKVVEEQTDREQSLGTEEARLRKLTKDLTYYFEKAGRDAEQVDSQRAMDLSQDITQYFREREALEQQFQDIRNARKQLDFLITEVGDIERDIENLLGQTGLDISEGLEGLKPKIQELLDQSGTRQNYLNDISRLDYDLASYEDPRDAIKTMEARKSVIEDKIRNMVTDHPALANLPDPDEGGPKPSAIIPWGAAGGDSEAAKAKKNSILVQIRTVLNNRDEHYLDTCEELANVNHELVCARRAKLALEMARDVIMALSSETYSDWAVELNKESERLISELGMDIESLRFDKALHLILRLHGHERAFNSSEIVSKLSTGMREQVHWLARIIVSRFLSKHQPLPIVLDEPFSEADDTRFLNMMRFLMTSIAPYNQIILLSCHQQRHQWLISQLNDEERDRISFRSRETIAEEQQAYT